MLEGFWGLFAFLSWLALFGWAVGKAKRDHFFSLPDYFPWEARVSLLHVLAAFAIYFAAWGGLSLFLVAYLQVWPTHNLLTLSTVFTFLSSLTIFFFLYLLLQVMPAATREAIWLRPITRAGHSFAKDGQEALLALLLAFPLVVLLGHFLEWLLSSVFHIPQLPDQLAVAFVKMTLGHPFEFLLALLSIVCLAPLLEETLFRGILQSYLRTKVGRPWAIGLTALAFSLFHYSSEQEWGNVPIIGCLFLLALFLGLLYERRGSLAAPMFLHAAFNALSVFSLYFEG